MQEARLKQEIVKMQAIDAAKLDKQPETPRKKVIEAPDRNYETEEERMDRTSHRANSGSSRVYLY